MKIIIVGAGASGLVCALAIKEKHPNYQILVIDKNNKLGKKLRATGNGKANILNLFNDYRYLNKKAAESLFKDITTSKILNFFHSNHIATINYDGYVYPFSESANTFTNTLINEGKKIGIKYMNDVMALDYKDNVLTTNKGNFAFDKLVIASGLKSQTKLGADASFVLNLTKHGYIVEPLKVGLAPIKTVETTKEVAGLRRKVHLSIYSNNRKYFEEEGELLFKKDGLSGMVVFHASSIINRNNLLKPIIEIDFLNGIKFNGHYEDYFTEELAKYLSKYKDLTKVRFNVKAIYGFDDSVVTIGGVSLNNIDHNFNSKIEKNVYIIGEALNQDGLCGGYNLMWAFATALKVSDII